LAFAIARVLTLAEALHTASVNQPQLRQAEAQTMVARAREDEAAAPLMPQVTGSATYQRTTANFIPRPGSLPSAFGSGTVTGGMTAKSGHATTDTFNYFNTSLSLNQLLYDFNQTPTRYRAAKSLADAQLATEHATGLQVEVQVRTAYFTARADKALVEVARQTLANQERHLAQIEGFVRVGTRPEIDLAQARTDRANARVQLILSENGYETAKAQLNLAMGIEGPTDYDVADETLPPLAGEDTSTDQLLVEALKARPEVASLEAQVRAQELTLRAQKGGYGPSLSAGTSLSYGGVDFTSAGSGWNWLASVTLNWDIFHGLLTWATVREAAAAVEQLKAQRDAIRQQVRLDVDTARLAVRAAKEALVAAEEVLVNARERLRLAEGRYQAGVGNVIELGDAQVALTNAAAQKVQAEYNLATARAQLMKALGRR
jgi:outer membrane protein